MPATDFDLGSTGAYYTHWNTVCKTALIKSSSFYMDKKYNVKNKENLVFSTPQPTLLEIYVSHRRPYK